MPQTVGQIGGGGGVAYRPMNERVKLTLSRVFCMTGRTRSRRQSYTGDKGLAAELSFHVDIKANNTFASGHLDMICASRGTNPLLTLGSTILITVSGAEGC